MKIGIQTWGTNGDVRPFIALTDGLQRAGHEVTLIISSLDNRNYGNLCQQLAIPYQQVPERMNFNFQDFALRTRDMSPREWIKAFHELSFLPSEQEVYEAATRLTQQNDLVIGHYLLYPLKIAAHKLKTPHISITLCHGAIPTPTQPPFTFPDLGAYLNPWQWKLANFFLDQTLKEPFSKLWLSESLKPFKHVMTDLLRSDLLNLVAIDTELCPEYSEWAPVHQVCGFLNLPDNAEVWKPSAGLETFLHEGEKPVYMSFGSLQQARPEECMQLFIAAAKTAGCRGIIQTSSANYPADTRQESIYFVGQHPHQPVLKRCAAMVNHGGAGTVHAATRSGCPSIVVPFIDEQRFWAKQLQKLGLAPEPIGIKKVTVEQLATHIKSVLTSPSMRMRATEAASRIPPNKGVSQAVALIEQCMATLQ